VAWCDHRGFSVLPLQGLLETELMGCVFNTVPLPRYGKRFVRTAFLRCRVDDPLEAHKKDVYNLNAIM
jgi:hypothetical protein